MLYYEYARDVSRSHPHFIIVQSAYDTPELVEMIEWCAEQFGDFTIDSENRPCKIRADTWLCFPDTTCFQFSREADVCAFKMRWA